MTTDKKTLDLARQWAEHVQYGKALDDVQAAADLISSLPDEWVDASELRYAISAWEFSNIPAAQFVDMVRDTLPTPPAPRTMAEIEWDDAEHHLAEARVAVGTLDGNISDTVIMLGVNRFGNISALDTSTWAAWALSKDTLTPTGRKYRLEPEEESSPEEAAIQESNLALDRFLPRGEQVLDPAYTYRDKAGNKWVYMSDAWRWVDSLSKEHGLTGYHTPPAEHGPYTRIEDTK